MLNFENKGRTRFSTRIKSNTVLVVKEKINKEQRNIFDLIFHRKILIFLRNTNMAVESFIHKNITLNDKKD